MLPIEGRVGSVFRYFYLWQGRQGSSCLVPAIVRLQGSGPPSSACCGSPTRRRRIPAMLSRFRARCSAATR